MNSEGEFVPAGSIPAIRSKQDYIMLKKIKEYINEALDELLHKVTWPTWKELQSSALVVMVASFIIALVIFVMDISFENIMKFIYGLFY